MARTTELGQAETTVPLRTVIDNRELALDVVAESLRPGALDRPVRWAHVSELLDPGPYLHGDELLLTAGVNLPADTSEVDRYVERLSRAGITALGFGITPPQHEVLPDSLRSSCVRHGLPLLVAPTRTPFLAISRAVSLAISRAAQREQLRITEAREALTKLAGGGAGEVTRELARRISGWVALVADDDRVVADYRSPWPLPADVGGMLVQLRSGTGIRSATTTLADGAHVMAQPLYPQATASHLLVAGRSDRFDSTDRAIVAIGAALLGLIGRAGSDTARLGAAAISWLLGDVPAAEALSSVVPARDYRLVAGEAIDSGPREAEAGYDWLRSRLDTPLVRLSPGPRFTAIAGKPLDSVTLSELHAKHWLVAVSGPVKADQLPRTVAEAEALLQRARSLSRPATAGTGDDLTALVPPDAAASFAGRRLGELYRLDAERGEDLLVPTLRCWLAHHGRWDRTASALAAHRNSVRHRIGQIERVLDVDLADPDTRMELWFALRWGGSPFGASRGIR